MTFVQGRILHIQDAAYKILTCAVLIQTRSVQSVLSQKKTSLNSLWKNLNIMLAVKDSSGLYNIPRSNLKRNWVCFRKELQACSRLCDKVWKESVVRLKCALWTDQKVKKLILIKKWNTSQNAIYIVTKISRLRWN